MMTNELLNASSSGPIAYDARGLSPVDSNFSLVVAGASNLQPYMTAGHLILRVKGERYDYSFDWGIFDPSKEGFFLDYIFGRLDYQHLVRPMHETIHMYYSERRSLIEYQLNLDLGQKQKLIDRLADWAKPENSVYRYDIVYNNCSTVIGGLIAEVASEKTRSNLRKPAGTTIRKLGLPYLAHFPVIEIFSDLAGGQLADQEVTYQHLFYLPVLVPKVLKQANENLLSKPTILQPGLDLPPSSISWTHRLGWLFVAFCFFVTTVGILFRRYRWLIWLIAPILIIHSLLALIILFLTLFSQHSFTWNNFHVLFFWPWDFIFIFMFGKNARGCMFYSLVHILLAILAMLLSWVLFAKPQDFSAGLFFSLPLWICLFVLSLMGKGFSPKKEGLS